MIETANRDPETFSSDELINLKKIFEELIETQFQLKLKYLVFKN